MKKIALGLITLLMLQGCNSHDAKLIKTFLVNDVFKKYNNTTIAYEGYAFNATLNDIPIIEISNKDKIKSLEGYLDIASVRWRLLKPINGKDIKVQLQRRRIKEHDIGKIKSYEVKYNPLTEIKIETKKIRVEDKSILLNGSAMIIYKDVIDRVPVGDYVISVTARGSKNWDRKEVFVQIREEDNVSKFL